MNTNTSHPLLAHDEPPAFDILRANGSSPIVIVCDHASNRVPRCLQQLGLDPSQLEKHIAWDAGTANVARLLSAQLDATVILSNYSRLVIDCNRMPGSSGSIVTISDGVPILGNQHLSEAEQLRRQRELFFPYQQAIDELLQVRNPAKTLLVGLHSFTPSLGGQHRPWSIGVCYGKDRRLADQLLTLLPEYISGEIGNNQPYQIDSDIDFTLPHHTSKRGIQHVMLEIRRDEIATEAQTTHWAACLANALNSVT
ncbi:N-formylglutamate amidohydrolase [Chrysiogenes arsenatis]|uniref:N-formylglutamate amidohydrolase n=1 Tax=Chrysiogenes arsenatis TaxID=309797 RepID=UPI0004216533|nr:N-formylglutamate amidohydrolase [Chrysiogenes arsenatis]